ncbi:Na+/K+-ATPase alpha subunit [Haematococcus lacustris]
MDIADFSSKQTVSWSQANALTRLVTIATVCNKARFLKAEEGAEGAVVPLTGYGAQLDQRKVAGDATDIGLLRYCDRLAPEHLVRAAYPPLFTIPFNSANKWSLVVTPAPGSPGQHVVMMKGAPEVVLTKCSHFYHNGHELVIDDGFRQSMTSAYERCGFMGERVLGFAYKTIPGQAAEQYAEEGGGPPLTGLVFMGLFSLMDPPKPNVPEAVQSCRRAGIRVAMVTGDHPLTAEAIARKVGIITLKTQREVAVELGIEEEQVPYEHPLVGAVVVNGAKLREIAEGDIITWDAILDHEEVVFARTTPQQKLQIVEHLQRRGEIVAVTGDGVNDSPALAKAQIGVAMGIGGSDVAREAADIILLDDEFSSIVAAVEEGRVIFDNLRKTIAYTLTHALPELFPIFLNLALSFPLGLGGLLILSIDLVTEQGPAISLAYEPAEANVMLRPPRDVATERLIDGRLLRYSYLIAGVLQSAVCMIAFFSVFWWYGISVPQVAFGIDRGNFLVPDGSSSNLDTTRGWGHQPRDPARHLLQAQAAWYVTLVMCQFWHIWMCKTRQVSIFRHGIFRNTVTLYGCVISLVVILGIVYIHGLHSIFLTRDLIGIGWLPMLIFLLIMLPFTEWSKWRTRLHPEGFVSRYVQW